jgi:LmbE family N-acetylglucosaminyl deacetylase
MTTIILSPHLDDAVLSCWHVLLAPGEVEVINVFAGIPPDTAEPAWWDQLTGAISSPSRVRERVREDREALAVAGRASVNLGFLDDQYRTAQQPIQPIVDALGQRIPESATVYAPADLGGIIDHALVRDAALELERTGVRVALYADLPHATRHGWPAWVMGSRPDAPLDLAAGLWDRALSAAGLSPPAIVAHVHVLDGAARAGKLQALRAYRTQLPALDEMFVWPIEDRTALGYEVAWRLTLSRNGPEPAPRTPRPASRPSSRR